MSKVYFCPVCLGNKHRQAVVCRKCADSVKHTTSRKGLPCLDCQKPVRDWYSKRCLQCSLKYRTGSTNPNWKGGIQTQYRKDRVSDKYIQWRRSVFERDHYACHLCNDSKGGNLVAHHILTFKNFPHLRFDIGNGVTMCKNCHIRIHKTKDPFWVADRWFRGAFV